MKLVHSKLDYQIEFKENIVNIMIIENPVMLRKLIEDIILQLNCNDGDFTLSENYEILQFNKYVDIISDIFTLELNQKKIINKIYADIKTVAYESENYLKTNSIISSIVNYIDDIIMNMDVNLATNCEIDIVSLLKAADVKIDDSCSKTILERIIDYISLMQEYSNVKCIVFVNLKSFLSDDELTQVYKHSFYKKVNLLLFESVQCRYNNEQERVFILDRDLCELY